MTTIREIAELAGVSRGTVDRVLNKRGSVNPQTEERILEIAKALNYKPNKAGIVLAAQKKKLVLGVVLFGAGNPFFDLVETGITKKAGELDEYNCSVILKRVPDGVEEQLVAIHDLLAEGIHGLALSPYNDPRVIDVIHDCSDRNIPVVTLNTDIPASKRIAYVGSNYFHSGETAAGLMHLITSGEVKAGIVTGSAHVLCHTERIAGFTSCIQNNYPNIKIVETIANNDDDFISYDLTTRLLSEHPEINALFFTAAGVYGGCRAVTAMGKASQITILTFDDIPTTRDFIASGMIAATICQQPVVQGSKPLDILFGCLTTGELPHKEVNYTQVDIRIKENMH